MLGVLGILAVDLAVLLGALTLLWLVSLKLRDASIIDIAWGLAFVLVAWTTRAQLASPSAVSLILPVAVTAWGLRLSVYLARRNLGHGEDKRYQAMRAARPDTFWRWSFGAVFMLQGVLCVIVSLPVSVGQVAAQVAAPAASGAPGAGALTGWHIVGLALFVVGLGYEAIADWQLARFKRDPQSRGQVMDRGLWRHTRHPNYFGEAVLWWGLWLVAAAAPDARWTVLGPLVITTLLLRVSGVALLEKTIGARRPAYAEYIRRTNAFIPGPRRR